jgi:hypothetical protein
LHRRGGLILHRRLVLSRRLWRLLLRERYRAKDQSAKRSR